ncbi:MAG: DUF6492 family protein [Lachnospiraceae bacterium]|nr:DUF6492 family protein [Lachnospiraceae bacterium]
MSDSGKIQVIIPTITKDYLRMRHLVPERIIRYLPAKELIFIGNSELCDLVNKDITEIYADLPIRALNEEELVKRQPVIDYINERAGRIKEELVSPVRPGWYYQQFLKMTFSSVCEGDYYMSWDMDTVPLRELGMFDAAGRPVFDIKKEFIPGYFSTIETLLGLKKVEDGSFISEHMIFDKDLMIELIKAIEDSPVKGGNLWEKIMEAVDDDYITLGFSEFETYGTYVTAKYPEAYGRRRFNSLRRGSWFVRESDVTEDDLAWIGQDYDALTFENADQIDDMVQLFRNPKYRNNMSAKKFYETILESGYFGEYKDGWLDAGGGGDWYAPV